MKVTYLEKVFFFCIISYTMIYYKVVAFFNFEKFPKCRSRDTQGLGKEWIRM